MFSIEEFYKSYETETTDIVVNDTKFSLMLPKYLFRFINPHDLFHDFPLWAKSGALHGFCRHILLKCQLIPTSSF